MQLNFIVMAVLWPNGLYHFVICFVVIFVFAVSFMCWYGEILMPFGFSRYFKSLFWKIMWNYYVVLKYFKILEIFNFSGILVSEQVSFRNPSLFYNDLLLFWLFCKDIFVIMWTTSVTALWTAVSSKSVWRV